MGIVCVGMMMPFLFLFFYTIINETWEALNDRTNPHNNTTGNEESIDAGESDATR